MKVTYRVMSLRPYPGKIHLFDNLEQMRCYYSSRTKEAYPYKDEPQGGRFVRLDGKDASETVWLVYARKPHVLAHELAHILLCLFKEIGSDPAEGNGEPFCYMLSQLMLDAR